MSHIRMSYVTYVNELLWPRRSFVTRMNEVTWPPIAPSAALSCLRSNGCLLSHVGMSYGTHKNELCHMYA